MKKNNVKKIAVAALAGAMALGSVSCSMISKKETTEKHACGGKNGCKAKSGCKAKHSCKGKNKCSK